MLKSGLFWIGFFLAFTAFGVFPSVRISKGGTQIGSTSPILAWLDPFNAYYIITYHLLISLIAGSIVFYIFKKIKHEK
ncbi:MAG: hypothetical protein ACYTFY_12395 [Planctomycetota bacterium]|jgi:hypothetical protein